MSGPASNETLQRDSAVDGTAATNDPPSEAEVLRALIRGGDVDGVVEFFSGMSERRRRDFRPLMHQGRWSIGGPREQAPGLAWAAACLAVDTLAQVRARLFPTLPPGLFARVVGDRKPRWINRIVSDRRSGIWARMLMIPWSDVRELERRGLCNAPEGPEFSERAVRSLLSDHPPLRLRTLLKEHPELRADLWRVFDEDGAARALHTETSRAFAALVDDEIWPRPEVLDACLAALAHDLSPQDLRGLLHLLGQLAPTPEEHATRQAALLVLLGSPLSTVVKYALGALHDLASEERLDVPDWMTSLAPALAGSTKGNATRSLALLGRAAAPGESARAAEAAVAGLRHPDPQVQEKAADIVCAVQAPSADLKEAVREVIVTVSPMERARLATWLGTDAVEDRQPAPETPTHVVMDRLAQLDFGTRTMLGVRVGREEAGRHGKSVGGVHERSVESGRDESGGVVGGLGPRLFEIRAVDPTDAPRVLEARRIHPILDLDELVLRLAATLEDPRSAEEREAVLDGVSRLCDLRSQADLDKVKPVVARAAELMQDTQGVPFSGWSPRADMCALVLGAWGKVGGGAFRSAVQRMLATIPSVLRVDDARIVLSHRIREVALRAERGIAKPLLAAPTHRPFWIDPLVFVERLTERSSIDRLDLIQALLRLTPDRRSEALETASRLRGWLGAAVRHALGGAERRRGPSEVWTAATCARDPQAEEEAWSATESVLRRSQRDGTVWSRSVLKDRVERWADETGFAPPWGPGASQPVDLLRRGYSADGAPPGGVAGMAGVWPQNPDAFFRVGSERFVWNIDAHVAAWENQQFIQPLLDPDTPLGPWALRLLALSLGYGEAATRGLATEALIEAISDGRVVGGSLVADLCWMRERGTPKATRWAESFRLAASQSPLHALIVADTLSGYLEAGLSTAEHGLHALLEVLLECQATAGAAVARPLLRERLSELGGSSKAARLARKLLALEGDGQVFRERAVHESLATRLRRADRWRDGPGIG